MFFFKGSVFYTYIDRKYNATNNISDFWIGLPNDIDTAFFLDTNGKFLYFTKGPNLYKFKLHINKGPDAKITSYGYVLKDYPKPISSIYPRLPSNLDTAYNTYCEGIVYFFKDNYYYYLKSGDHIVKGPHKIRDLVPGFCM